MMRLLTYLIVLCSSTALLAQTHTRMVGNKSFELSNHLGNVLEVTTDRKVQQNTEAEIVAFNDYYPYGVLMEGRHGQQVASEYRYAFQGQEKDDAVKGTGNSYNYTYRIHDSRLGRFFAVDPLVGEYPHYSSYQFSGNKVVAHVELEGLEDRYFTGLLLNEMFGVNKIGVAMMAGDPGGQSLHIAIESEALSIMIGAGIGAGFEGQWGQSEISLRGNLVEVEADIISGETKGGFLSGSANLKFMGNDILNVKGSVLEANLNLYGGWLKEDKDFFQSLEFIKFEGQSNIGLGDFSLANGNFNFSVAKFTPATSSSRAGGTLFNYYSDLNLADFQYNKDFSPEKYGIQAQLFLRLGVSFNLTQYNNYVEQNAGNLPLDRAMTELVENTTSNKGSKGAVLQSAPQRPRGLRTAAQEGANKD